jgi:hypothetical protein
MTDGGFFDENLVFIQNLIDWVNLDSDLIGIRSRGAAARRLVRVDRGTEVAIETMTYVVPMGFLLALAGYRIWRRRNTEPIIAAQSSSTPAGPGRAE